MYEWGCRYGELVERRAARQPTRVAIHFEGADHTYDALARAIQGYALALRDIEVNQGTRVVCVSGNRPEVLALAYACSRLGAVFVPLNGGATADEIDYVLRDVEPAAVCFDSTSVPAAALAGQSWVTTIDLDVVSFSVAAENGSGAHIPEPVLDGSDPALICYTSGTTGHPKGVVLSHAGLHWNSINTLLGLDLSSDDIALINTPLFHVAGLNVLTVNVLYKGGTVRLCRRFDAEHDLELVNRSEVTVMFAVPTMLTLMERSPGFLDADLSPLRWVLGGGAPFSPDTVQRWAERGVPIISSFGLSEAGPSVTFRRTDDVCRKSASTGAPAALTDVVIVDEEGHPLERGQTGDIIVRGPHIAVGYWRDPDATANTFRPNGLRTGDRGYLDEDGDLVIVGRSKDTIISGGENIDPVEIEEVVARHPAVAEAVVVGIPDETWGERVVVVVVLHEGSDLDLAELRVFTADSLARYKLPRQVEIWDRIPKSSVGKIQRAAIKTRLAVNEPGNAAEPGRGS